MQSIKVYGIEFNKFYEDHLNIVYDYKGWTLLHNKQFNMWKFDNRYLSFSICAPDPKQAINNYICHRIKYG